MFELDEEPPKKAVLFVNVRSRLGAEGLEIARNHLQNSGLELIESRSFVSSLEMQDAVKYRVSQQFPLILVGGGDGTFSSVARYFANRPTVLGIIPTGTGNAFARDLGIQEDIQSACNLISTGKVAHIDMGIVGNRQFLNVASIGLSTKIAGHLDPRMKRIFGKTIYVLSILRGLSTVAPFLVKLELPDRMESFECLQLVIGNGRFHAGPFPISPDAAITGGNLAVYALATKDKRAFVKLALWMQGGRHVDLEEVKYFRTKSGYVDTAPSQHFVADGEICFTTPQHFRVAEGALKVIVPKSFQG